MTKFDELCQSFVTRRDQDIKYQNECIQFTIRIGTGLKSYLNVPEKYFSYVPVHFEPEPDTIYNPAGSLYIDELKANWIFGIKITLFKAENIFPHQPILIRIAFYKENNAFYAQFSDGGDFVKVEDSNSYNYEEFFQRIYDSIKQYFEQGLEHFFEEHINPNKTEIPKKIGFSID